MGSVDRQAAEDDVVAFFARVPDAEAVVGLRERAPEPLLRLGFANARLQRTELGPLRRRLKSDAQVRVVASCQRPVHHDVFIEPQELFELAERDRFRGLGSLAFGSNTGERRTGDVHVEDGDVPARKRRSATACTRAASSCVRCQQSDRARWRAVRGSTPRRPERRTTLGGFVDVCNRLRNRRVRTFGSGGSARPGLEGLPDADVEISEMVASALTAAYARVELWVRLEAKGCAEQASPRLLQCETCAHDPRRLFTRPPEDLGECHGPTLPARHTSL